METPSSWKVGLSGGEERVHKHLLEVFFYVEAGTVVVNPLFLLYYQEDNDV